MLDSIYINTYGERFKISDIRNEIISSLESQDKYDNYRLIVASDSQRHKRRLRFIHMIILYNEHHGGRMWWTIKSTDRMDISQKIITETQKSIEILNYLMESKIAWHLDYMNEEQVSIHIDAGYAGASRCVADSCKGMVEGYGYAGVLKPKAWAASHCADRFSK